MSVDEAPTPSDTGTADDGALADATSTAVGDWRTSRRQLRVGLELKSSGHHPAVMTPGAKGRWIELTAPRSPGRIHRVRAQNLRDAQRKVQALRAEAAVRGAAPSAIFVDIEVLLDPDPRCALRTLARLDAVVQQATTLRYVGTPRGLAGLIDDMQSLCIADGVALLPSIMPDCATHALTGLLESLAALGFQAQGAAVDFAQQLTIGAAGLKPSSECQSTVGRHDECRSK